MKFTELSLKGVYLIEPEPLYDERGFFMRTYADEVFQDFGLNKKWVHESQSCSKCKGIIRGLHFQFPPYAETKLIRVIKGSIIDVFVDLRKNSATLGKWESVELSEKNKKMILIPRGFAHGFCTTSDDVEMIYKMDNIFSPENSGSILWNDTDLAINWCIENENPIISEKDSKAMTFTEFKEKYGGIEI